MSKLKGKVAVVTGASKGIGAAIAKSLAAEGASVVVNYASSKSGRETVVDSITAAGGKAVAVGGDVSKAAEAQGIIDAAIKNYGRLDILVNNSGVYEFAPIEDVTEEQFHRMFNINVLGLLLTTQAALKHIGEGGSIINIGSVVSRITPPASSIYTGTKGAVDAITGVLARELGPKKIRVNTINPGMVETEGTHAAGVLGSDFEKAIGRPDPARPPRSARRYRLGRGLPRFRRLGVAYGRADPRRRRSPLTSERHMRTGRHAMGKLDGKVAVITAATSGMALATAKLFVEEGAYVFITGRRKDKLDEAVKAIGRNVTGVQGDASNLDDLDRLYDTVKKTKGKIDVLFASAGMGELAKLGEITPEQFDNTFDLNVRGTLFTVQKALPLFNDGGSIFMNGSIATVKGFPAFSVYSASKAAVRSFARTWLLDLKERKIRVNVLSPGTIDTPILDPAGAGRERSTSRR